MNVLSLRSPMPLTPPPARNVARAPAMRKTIARAGRAHITIDLRRMEASLLGQIYSFWLKEDHDAPCPAPPHPGLPVATRDTSLWCQCYLPFAPVCAAVGAMEGTSLCVRCLQSGSAL